MVKCLYLSIGQSRAGIGSPQRYVAALASGMTQGRIEPISITTICHVIRPQRELHTSME
jgi:hypothetical protein